MLGSDVLLGPNAKLRQQVASCRARLVVQVPQLACVYTIGSWSGESRMIPKQDDQYCML